MLDLMLSIHATIKQNLKRILKKKKGYSAGVKLANIPLTKTRLSPESVWGRTTQGQEYRDTGLTGWGHWVNSLQQSLLEKRNE